MSQIVNVEVLGAEQEAPLRADSYDYSRLPEELRDQAMLAQGTVLTKLGGAVERVIDAGNTLRWAKQTLPHGEYLPWVQQACGLKPHYAQKLVKAAEWVNAAHERHLDQITDANTLFLLSADATPEDVREWVMERCAAGNPPTRQEVQERKRQAQGKPSRTLVQEALSVLKLSPEARELAAKAEHISTRQLLQELDLDELPNGREHSTPTHLYCKNGTGWWKLPQKPVVQVQAQQELISVSDFPAEEQHITVSDAANLMGFRRAAQLGNRLTPSNIKRLGFPKGNGYQARPSAVKRMCFVRPWP
jgi:hypothetical protein